MGIYPTPPYKDRNTHLLLIDRYDSIIKKKTEEKETT